MKQSVNNKSAFVATGLMLFALFFGAGNLIFPSGMGQQAGSNVFAAMAGFLLTGAGLPLLGVIAFGYSGARDVQQLASRVAPWYGVLFAAALYLSIGPLFATPRTATVSFEIGVVPFMGETVSDSAKSIGLFIFCLIFFGLSFWLAVSPGKLVDRIGRVLTPALLLTIAVLVGYAAIAPMAPLQAPAEAYQSDAFTKGILAGYETMDALAALVFAIIVIEAVRYNMGINDDKQVLRLTIRSGLVAASALAIVYILIAYMGATSVGGIGLQDNGAAVLSKSAQHYFGTFGNILLAAIVFLACLTTSVGLITSCGEYFARLIPALSYHKWAVVFTVVSFGLANFGLGTIIKFSIPVLMLLYPLTIAIIVLTFLHKLFDGKRVVYATTILFTSVLAVVDGWKTAHSMFGGAEDGLIMRINETLSGVLPLYSVGLGWVIPAAAGFVLGFILSKTVCK